MSILYFFAEIRSTPLNFFFGLFSLMGEELLILSVICILYWCYDKRLACRLGAVFFISGLAVQCLKITVRAERPWIRDPDFTPVQSAITTATGYSFPSGHTQGATALFGSLAFELTARRRYALSVLVLVTALMTGISRMYLGVHTPADVAVAFALTLAVAALVMPLTRQRDPFDTYPLASALIPALISAASAVYAAVLMYGGTLDTVLGADVCKAAGAGLGFAVGVYLERRYVRFRCDSPRIRMHIIKTAAGLAGALALKESLKLILGSSAISDAIRYMILVLWVTALYPLILETLRRRNDK